MKKLYYLVSYIENVRIAYVLYLIIKTFLKSYHELRTLWGLSYDSISYVKILKTGC